MSAPTDIERATLKLLDRHARQTMNADILAYIEQLVTDPAYTACWPAVAEQAVYEAQAAARQADKSDPDYTTNLREARRAYQYAEALRRLSFAVVTYRQSGRTTAWAVTRDDNRSISGTFHESTDLVDAVVEFTTQALEAQFQDY